VQRQKTLKMQKKREIGKSKKQKKREKAKI